MDVLTALGDAVSGSAFGSWASGSAAAYPVANLLHLLGLVWLVGGIGLLDLRIAGLFRSLPLAPMARALTPFALAGFGLMLVSGATMFAADAEAFAASTLFRWKLVLIALAALNAVVFRWWFGSAGAARAMPGAGRVFALLSLMLWLAAAALGRLIAYS